MQPGKGGLVVECFQVGHAACHIEPDNALGLGLEMQWADHPLPFLSLLAGGIHGKCVLGQHRVYSH